VIFRRRKMSKILVKVVGGKCQGGYHRIGDTFEIDYDDALTPQGMCLGAFNSVLPCIWVLLCDGEFRWEEKTKTKTRVACGDPKGIILEIERI
jgi:uncharacterized repeat protein (TIGR04076 family)